MRPRMMTLTRVARSTETPMACAVSTNTIARVRPVPSLLIWAPRGMEKDETFRGTSSLSAHSMLIGMELVLEQVMKEVIMMLEAVLKKRPNPILVNRNTRVA